MRETAGKASLWHFEQPAFRVSFRLVSFTSGAGVMDQPVNPCNITLPRISLDFIKPFFPMNSVLYVKCTEPMLI